MSKENILENILFTIISLKKYKSKPTEERIVQHVNKKFGIPTEDIKSSLQKMTTDKIVTKFETKGKVSYLVDPDNNKLFDGNHFHLRINNLRKVRKRIIRIVQFLCNAKAKSSTTNTKKSPNTTLKLLGVTNSEIYDTFSQRWSLPTETKEGTKIDLFKMALDAEIQSGKLIILPDGSISNSNLELKKFVNKQFKQNNKNVKTSKIDDATNVPIVEDRRLKKHRDEKKLMKEEKEREESKSKSKDKKIIIKENDGIGGKQQEVIVTKEFSGETPTEHKKKKGRKRKNLTPIEDSRTSKTMVLQDDTILPIIGEDVCDNCGLKIHSLTGETDLLRCIDCTSKEHPSCLSYSKELASRALSSPWQCTTCKSCQICHDTDDPLDSMLICDACDRGYHMNCHTPIIFEKPNSNWLCNKCLTQESSTITDVADPNVVSEIPTSSAVTNMSQPLHTLPIILNIPDCNQPTLQPSTAQSTSTVTELNCDTCLISTTIFDQMEIVQQSDIDLFNDKNLTDNCLKADAQLSANVIKSVGVKINGETDVLSLSSDGGTSVVMQAIIDKVPEIFVDNMLCAENSSLVEDYKSEMGTSSINGKKNDENENFLNVINQNDLDDNKDVLKNVKENGDKVNDDGLNNQSDMCGKDVVDNFEKSIMNSKMILSATRSLRNISPMFTNDFEQISFSEPLLLNCTQPMEASQWSVDDLYKYLVDLGFEREAEVFRKKKKVPTATRRG